MTRRNTNSLWFLLLCALSIVFLAPIVIVLYNSLKGQFYISGAPFAFPNAQTFSGLKNYVNGVEKIRFFQAFGYSLFITVFSVGAIVLFTSMTAWYLVRVKSWFTRALYYLFVFSMIVPFQMVMFTMSKTINVLRLDNPVGLVVVYLGFGAGLSVFLFAGFIRGVPLEIEEAAVIDGSGPVQTFFQIGRAHV